MDVWVEFKNASKWQAEALFRNFFPCDEDEEEVDMESLSGNVSDSGTDISSIGQDVDSKTRVRTYMADSSGARTPTSPNEKDSTSLPSLWTLSTSIASSASSLISASGATSPTLNSPSGSTSPPLPRTFSGSPVPTSPPVSESGHAKRPSLASARMDKDQFGASNTAYLPPPPDEALAKNRVKPFDKKTLAILAKRFADGLPDDEFSVAGLQGCES
jgi:chaperone BCS1